MIRHVILLLLPVLTVLSCSGDKDSESTPPASPEPVVVLEDDIDEAGGLLEAPAGTEYEGLRLYIPAEALSTSTHVKVIADLQPGAIATGYRFITAFWRVDLSGAVLEKPWRMAMPVLDGESVAEGVAVLRWDDNTTGWDPGLTARIDTGPDGTVTAGFSEGLFAGISRTGGAEAAANVSGFDVMSDVPHISTDAAAWCRFGATLLARHQHVSGNPGFYSAFDAPTALMVTERLESLHRIERLGLPQALADEVSCTPAEIRTSLQLALGATNRPVWLLLTDRLPLLAYGYGGNSFKCYNPRVGPVQSDLDYNGTDFTYAAQSWSSIWPLGADPEFDPEIDGVLAAFAPDDTAVTSAAITTAGGTLNVTTGALSGALIEIGSGDLGATTTLTVLEPGFTPPLPTGAERCSPFLKLTGPPDNLFEGQIAVTLPYSDPTTAEEGKLQMGCYLPKTGGWSLTQISSRDTSGNTIRSLCRTAGIYAVFGYGSLASGRTTSASSCFIYHSWPSGESEQDVINTLVARRVRRLHISALERVGSSNYYCRFPLESSMTGVTGLDHSYTWFDYSTLLDVAHQNGIEVVFAITIFSSTIPPDDPDTPGTHAYHLVNTVIPFLRDQCIGLDGIMLDYIRYDVGSWTESDRDLISRIVARIREALGHKSQTRRHRLYACVWCFTGGNEDGRMAVGQRYSDFALDCDVLLPMMYGGNDPYPAADLEWYSLRTALYRMPRNKTGAMAGIMTYGNATPTTIHDQLDAALSWHMDGFAMYRYSYTSSAEWDEIDDFAPPW